MSAPVKLVRKYDIGTAGVKWGATELEQWRSRQVVKRSYSDEVLQQIESLKDFFTVESFGSLSCDPEKYVLYVLTSPNYDASKPTVLITGGCHGYETSGVQGALRFLRTKGREYAAKFNIVSVPCLSPWAYETVNRWTPEAVDPNRTFSGENETCEQSAALIAYLAKRREGDSSFGIFAHFDLHETTDEDNTEFTPAKAARDGVVDEEEFEIPDGFYLVGNSAIPTPEFHDAILKSVQRVTHVADADPNGCITGQPIAQQGLISVPGKHYGLCFSVAEEVKYAVITEVHPSAPRVTDEHCNDAQVAAICGGLDYLLRSSV